LGHDEEADRDAAAGDLLGAAVDLEDAAEAGVGRGWGLAVRASAGWPVLSSWRCEAYTKQLGCLLKYSPGGIPLIYGVP